MIKKTITAIMTCIGALAFLTIALIILAKVSPPPSPDYKEFYRLQDYVSYQEKRINNLNSRIWKLEDKINKPTK